MTEIFSIPPAPARSLWVLFAIALLLGGMLLLFAYFTYSSRSTRYSISPAGLAIQGTLYGRTIPWSGLVVEEARVVDLREAVELQPTLRTNGVGLPGYQAGWFRLRRAGKGLAFLTDRSRVVVIPTRLGYTVLLSVEDPPGLLEALRRGAPG